MRKSTMMGVRLFIHRVLVMMLVAALLVSPEFSYAQSLFVSQLPKPGVMVSTSSSFTPVLVKGLVIHPDKPLNFDFIVDSGNATEVRHGVPLPNDVTSVGTLHATSLHNDNMRRGDPAGRPIEEETLKMAKYFLAAITVPEDQLWVNLSPYEKDRVIENELGQTVLGRDMLAQDYLLKQLTASLIYPENGLGKEFWSKVYAQAQAKFGTTDIPVDTFNKVWIMPDKAEVFERRGGSVTRPEPMAVYVTQARLKVMLDTDYLATQNNLSATRGHSGPEGASVSPSTLPSDAAMDTKATQVADRMPDQGLAKEILREIILPALEKEVNEGQNFAAIRQIYHAAILAKWYRERIKDTLLASAYVGKNKVGGVTTDEKTLKEEIYARYIAAYKKGVFNYIKDGGVMARHGVPEIASPRHYFSGGVANMGLQDFPLSHASDAAMLGSPIGYLYKAMIKIAELKQLWQGPFLSVVLEQLLSQKEHVSRRAQRKLLNMGAGALPMLRRKLKVVEQELLGVMSWGISGAPLTDISPDGAWWRRRQAEFKRQQQRLVETIAFIELEHQQAQQINRSWKKAILLWQLIENAGYDPDDVSYLRQAVLRWMNSQNIEKMAVGLNVLKFLIRHGYWDERDGLADRVFALYRKYRAMSIRLPAVDVLISMSLPQGWMKEHDIEDGVISVMNFQEAINKQMHLARELYRSQGVKERIRKEFPDKDFTRAFLKAVNSIDAIEDHDDAMINTPPSLALLSNAFDAAMLPEISQLSFGKVLLIGVAVASISLVLYQWRQWWLRNTQKGNRYLFEHDLKRQQAWEWLIRHHDPEAFNLLKVFGKADNVPFWVYEVLRQNPDSFYLEQVLMLQENDSRAGISPDFVRKIGGSQEQIEKTMLLRARGMSLAYLISGYLSFPSGIKSEILSMILERLSGSMIDLNMNDVKQTADPQIFQAVSKAFEERRYVPNSLWELDELKAMGASMKMIQDVRPYYQAKEAYLEYRRENHFAIWPEKNASTVGDPTFEGNAALLAGYFKDGIGFSFKHTQTTVNLTGVDSFGNVCPTEFLRDFYVVLNNGEGHLLYRNDSMPSEISMTSYGRMKDDYAQTERMHGGYLSTNQATVSDPISFVGIGLHLGERVSMSINPARANTGIVFVRNGHEISAVVENTMETPKATMLIDGKGGVVLMPEHILSALGSIGVNNARIELDADEVPVFDGSAHVFKDRLLAPGAVKYLNEKRRRLVIEKPLVFLREAEGVKILVLPSSQPGLRLSYLIDFANPAVGNQFKTIDFNEELYWSEIASSKTFIEKKHLDALAKDRRYLSLAPGRGVGAVVLDEQGGFMADRFTVHDEAVRHKLLDLFGDLQLAGFSINAHVIAIKAGHRDHVAMVRKLTQMQNTGVYESYSDEMRLNIIETFKSLYKAQKIPEGIYAEVLENFDPTIANGGSSKLDVSINADFASVVSQALNVNPKVDQVKLMALFNQASLGHEEEFNNPSGVVSLGVRVIDVHNRMSQGVSFERVVRDNFLLSFLRDKMKIPDVYIKETARVGRARDAIQENPSVNADHYYTQYYEDFVVGPKEYDAILRFCVLAYKKGLPLREIILGETKDQYRAMVERGVTLLGKGGGFEISGGKENGMLLLDRMGQVYPAGIVLSAELVQEISQMSAQDRRALLPYIIEKLVLAGIDLKNSRFAVRSNPYNSTPGRYQTKLDVPAELLLARIAQVADSWYMQESFDYRQAQGISDDYALPVIVQVYKSGKSPDLEYFNKKHLGENVPLYVSGVFSTRNPDTNKVELFGRYLENADGDGLMTHGARGEDIGGLALLAPDIFNKFLELQRLYESDGLLQEVEFVVSNGALYFLQTRDLNLSPQASALYAKELLAAGKVSQAVVLLESLQRKVKERVIYRVQDGVSLNQIAGADAATPGAFQGRLAWDITYAKDLMAKNEPVVFVAQHASDGFEMMPLILKYPKAALIAAYGNASSHEAVLARLSGVTALMRVNLEMPDPEDDLSYAFTGPLIRFGEARTYRQGDEVLIDGDTKRLYDAPSVNVLEENGIVLDASFGVDMLAKRQEFLAPYLDVNGALKAGITTEHLRMLNLLAFRVYEGFNLALKVEEARKPSADRILDLRKAVFMANLRKHFLHDLLRMREATDVKQAREDAAMMDSLQALLLGGGAGVVLAGVVGLRSWWIEWRNPQNSGRGLEIAVPLTVLLIGLGAYKVMFESADTLNSSWDVFLAWASTLTFYGVTRYGLSKLRAGAVQSDLDKKDGAMSMASSDRAMVSSYGGIDLNNIGLSKSGNSNVSFDESAVEVLFKDDFSGFAPVVMDIIPVNSPQAALGLSAT